jgi:tryptophanyl-tRNA synthetase
MLRRTTHVPVGEDQTQHLELSRDLADLFNRTFKSAKPMFPLPSQIHSTYSISLPTSILLAQSGLLLAISRRILSLKDPTSKMSKSSPDVQSRILLSDTAAQIRTKIRGAVTDSISGITYDPVARPGTSNLLTILAACTNEHVTDVAQRYEAKGHGHLKADVVDVVEETIRAPRAEFEKIRHETEYLNQVAKDGAEKAKERSGITMREVRARLGLS